MVICSSKPPKPTDSFGFASDAALQAVIAIQVLFHFTRGITQHVDVCSHIGGAIVGLGAAQAVKYRNRLRNAEGTSVGDIAVLDKTDPATNNDKRAGLGES